MAELSKKLAISLLLVIILTTMITTFAFFQIEKSMMGKNYIFPGNTASSGQVQVEILQNQKTPTALEGGKVSINIKDGEEIQNAE